MSLLSQAQALARQAAGQRAQLWPVTVTLSTDTATPKAQVKCSGSPPTRTRMPHELRGGYVMRTTRVISLLRSQLTALPSAPTVALGTEFTITADPLNPVNVGTIWRTFELTDSSSGSEIRCVCFKLD